MGGVKGGTGFKLNDVSPSTVGRPYSFTSNATSELLLLVEEVKQTMLRVCVEFSTELGRFARLRVAGGVVRS